MRILTAAELEGALRWDLLVERLRQAFRRDLTQPARSRHVIEAAGLEPASLLLMPAWEAGRHIGIKVATVFPSNGERGLPAVIASYLLLDGQTGTPLALLDGSLLTLKRTAAASALAASYLARPDSERLLMVGTGALAPYLVAAHASHRPIGTVLIWGRDPKKAEALAKRMDKRQPFKVGWTDDLEAAARGADIISCATLSKEPLIKGEWLQPGTHLDLVGAFTPEMRESDDAAVAKARLFVDTREGALSEAGDILQAIQAGVIGEADIAGDLFELTRGEKAGRRFYDQITLFKSTGAALEDLAAAQLAVELV